jgi:hypothetical protein
MGNQLFAPFKSTCLYDSNTRHLSYIFILTLIYITSTYDTSSLLFLFYFYVFYATSNHISLLQSVCFILYLYMVSFLFRFLTSLSSINVSLILHMLYTIPMHDPSYCPFLILCFMLFPLFLCPNQCQIYAILLHVECISLFPISVVFVICMDVYFFFLNSACLH